MFSKLLLPESVTRQDGLGPEIAVESGSSTLLLTLGINRIIEQEILDVSVWGSADRHMWKQLTAFPRKSYCGTYPMVLDLSNHSSIKFLRAQWKVSRWDFAEPKPLFGFYLHAEDVKLRHAGAA